MAEWINKVWYKHIIMVEYYLTFKKEGNSGIYYNNMSEVEDTMLSKTSQS